MLRRPTARNVATVSRQDSTRPIYFPGTYGSRQAGKTPPGRAHKTARQSDPEAISLPTRNSRLLEVASPARNSFDREGPSTPGEQRRPGD